MPLFSTNAANPMNGDLFSPRQPDLFDAAPEQPKSETIRKERPPIRERLKRLIAQTDDFRLLERIPLTKPGLILPCELDKAIGDELSIVFLDTETTGLSAESDTIIELGLVRASFSPSAKKLVSIDRIISAYEDPGRPLSPFITELTGITDDMVRGKRIDEKTVADCLDNVSLIVAHNASFDRPFFEKRFTGFDDMNWACSLEGIDWNRLGFSRRKLEDLSLKSGYFYEAHRATIDCLALAWLLHIHPDAMADLLEQAIRKTVIVHAFGAPFEARDILKTRGYRWHDGTSGANRHWWKEIPESALPEEKNFLDELYPNGSDRAGFEIRTAADRFRRR